MKTRLTAPFPYFGGKGRWAKDIWEHLGDVKVYSEPFCGSMAVLLANEPHEREIACDLDGMVCNFWRAASLDPEGVSYWADWPTIHQDLTARRHWLQIWRDEHVEQLSVDPHFFDPKVAGWWAWCVSSWIGPVSTMLENSDKIPGVGIKAGGKGVQAQRLGDAIPLIEPRGGGRGVSAQRNLGDQIPHASSHGGGRGVSVQRVDGDQIPYVSTHGGGQGLSAQRIGDQIPHTADQIGGSGVQAQRRTLEGNIGDGSRLLPWLHTLAQRLSRVIILNRDWTSAVTPSLLQHTPSSPKPTVGIFLDPPYRIKDRVKAYAVDDGDDPAVDSYNWAVENGGIYRIAYACRPDDFPLPDGWTASETRGFKGHRVESVRETQQDVIYYSPQCKTRLTTQRLF